MEERGFCEAKEGEKSSKRRHLSKQGEQPAQATNVQASR